MTTQIEVKHKITYNPDTGEFTHKNTNEQIGVKQGDKAGFTLNGRKYISINGIKYRAGQIAILYMTGVLPEYVGFHDGDVDNFKYSNLFASDECVRYRRSKSKLKSGMSVKRTSQYEITSTMPKKSPEKQKVLAVIDCLDGKPRGIDYIVEQTGISGYTVASCLCLLLYGKQVEHVSSKDTYKLTAKGHCRILSRSDELANEKRALHVLFYTVLHSTVTINLQDH